LSREIDRRDFSENKVTLARENELRTAASEVSDRLPGEQRIGITNFDATTGNPAVVSSEYAPAVEGHYIQQALDFVQNISEALGLEATQPAEFVADPHVQRTSSGAAVVNLQQQYLGITIFQASQTVRFDPDGALQDTAGSSVTVGQEMDALPRLSVEEAVLRAAQHVGEPQSDELGATDQFGEPLRSSTVDVSGFVPRVIAAFFDKPDQPTVLEAGPFGDEIKANLLWFAMNSDLRLTWEVIITMRNYEGQYRTIIDAETGEVLYCHQLVHYVAARGNVLQVDGGQTRQMVDFPEDWVRGIGFDASENWTGGPSYGSRGIRFADVTGDGRADAIFVNSTTVTVGRSTGSVFRPSEGWTGGPYFGSRGTFFADVTGDGLADAIVVNDDTVTVRRSTGSGFGPGGDWTGGPYFGSRGTFFADVDGDGLADAIVVNDDTITVRRSTGSGFGPNEDLTPGCYYGNRGTFFADVDGDGLADAIVVNDDTVTVRRSS
jgi:hypothetical protein